MLGPRWREVPQTEAVKLQAFYDDLHRTAGAVQLQLHLRAEQDLPLRPLLRELSASLERELGERPKGDGEALALREFVADLSCGMRKNRGACLTAAFRRCAL